MIGEFNMSNLVYAYKNKLWRVLHNFQYTGEAQPFTLDPGKYLLICHGAHGGTTRFSHINYGGSAYGVLTLDEKKTLYAFVGGNGESAIDNSTPGKGGFNGGGDGGRSYNNSYMTGAGGGGASDIRTCPIDYKENLIIKKTLPNEYTPLSYIQSSGTQYIDTGVFPSSDLKIELSFSLTKIGLSLNGIFGSYDSSSSVIKRCQIFQNGDINYGIGTSYYSIDEDLDIHNVTLDLTNLKVYDNGTECVTNFSSDLPTDYSMYIFARHNNSSVQYSSTKFYYVKIWSGDELIKYFVPCYSSDGTVGMFDLINQTFHTNGGSGTLIRGEELNDPVSIDITKEIDSLYSRIIVAGGGGGTSNINPTNGYAIYTGDGGGPVGGYPSTNSSDLSYKKYPDQTSGHEFGQGMSASDKTSSTTCGSEGASGGGGGWYGGYTSNLSSSYTSSGGGGGSGYVLTESSYKPEGYLLGEEYYLTETCMVGGTAIEPQISVCVEIDSVITGDTIIFPCVGECTSFTLNPGKYKLKCWGGDGGCRYSTDDSKRGGYSEGILTLSDITDLFTYVGGSGIGSGLINTTFSSLYHSYVRFNGGGSPASTTSVKGGSGGGATDFRIGSDSLYSRVIVAGGAGGNGMYLGGAGGGESGEACQSSGCGTSPGPGTQSKSPTTSTSTYSAINGGFGYGGNGVYSSSGYGGAGGGGWYGGSGTYPDGSKDDDKGGNGGSGYVLTESSYKPEGYLLGEEYYLTETSTVTGGNNLPIGHTRAEIEVIESVITKILCHDEEGYKYFDKETDSWVFISSTLSIDMFDKYGSYAFSNDNGLLNDYEILIKDDNNVIDNFEMDIVPIEQKISTTINSRMNPKRVIMDVDCDTDIYDFRCEVRKSGVGGDQKITLDTYVNKKDISDEKFRLYTVNLFSK